MPCDPLDRNCTVYDREQDGVPVVWVGPRDGGWIHVVDDSSAPKPCRPYSVFRSQAVIWVAIASFRDSLCSQTLAGVFDRAKYPDRVRVAVVQQNSEEDADCLEAYCEARPECRRSQVSVKRFHSSEAKGPTWARAQDADMLPADAEFCLRTDSHMAFANDWDSKQIDQWYSAENEFAVVSTYVADASQIRPDGTEVNVNKRWEVPHLCSILWQDGHVRNMQAKAARNLEKPKLTTLWAAGLSFSRCHAERTVPYDPHTPYIFWGEEFSRTARFFTHGYDVYTPHRTIVAHDYKKTQGDPSHFKWNGKGGPRIHRNATIKNIREESNRRIWSLLEMPGGDGRPLGAYGLGQKRSLDQLIQFTGIQLRNRSIFANRCGNIDWVEWKCQPRRDDLSKSAIGGDDDGLPGSVHNQKAQDDDPLNDALALLHMEHDPDNLQRQPPLSPHLEVGRLDGEPPQPSGRILPVALFSATTCCFLYVLRKLCCSSKRRRRRSKARSWTRTNNVGSSRGSYHLTKIV